VHQVCAEEHKTVDRVHHTDSKFAQCAHCRCSWCRMLQCICLCSVQLTCLYILCYLGRSKTVSGSVTSPAVEAPVSGGRSTICALVRISSCQHRMLLNCQAPTQQAVQEHPVLAGRYPAQIAICLQDRVGVKCCA
jgi:hypothetical protein